MRRLIALVSFLFVFIPLALAQEGETVIPTGQKILAWIGSGQTPPNKPSANPGQLIFISGDGTIEPVMDLPANITHAFPCAGAAATSPNGQYFAFFMGRDTGELHLMTGTQVPTMRLRERINMMTCAGNGTFAFSPDSARVAYLDYPDDYNTASSPTTRLIVQETATGSELENFEETAAFTWYDTGVAYLTFFKSPQNEATEASISYWDGARDREIVARTAEEGCYYTTASLGTLPDGRLTAVLSSRCERAGRTVWQLYTVELANRSMTLIGEGETRGRYFPFARTNSLFVAPDGASAFFTVPDGVTNETVGLNVGALVAPGITSVFENNGIMPRISKLPYQSGNHSNLVSPDGRLLALVRNDADNDASVIMIDLSAPELPPIEISAGDRGNIVSELLFTPDSSKLIFVAGNETSAVYTLDTITGANDRLNRGRYGQGVMSPDGTKVALINRETYSERQPPYDTLVVLDIIEGFESQVFIGGEVVDARINNQQFIYPLAWRSSLP
jgi:hypothetical protein